MRFCRRSKKNILIFIILSTLIYIHKNKQPDYITYLPGDGNINLILTVPHSGLLTPSFIRDRTAGCYLNKKCVYNHICEQKNHLKCEVVTYSDMKTNHIAHNIRNRMTKKFGVKPHLIISNLKRTKLDPNRRKSEATFGDKWAEQAYDLYDHYIKSAIQSFFSAKRGLLIDIHGVNQHSMHWIEIGFRITKYKLNNDKITHKNSSVSNLYRLLDNDNSSFEYYIRGNGSIGGKLQYLGYKAIPSPDFPKPLKSHYFTGGTTIRKYSRYIDAIQIESPLHLREDKRNRITYSKDLTDCIMYFYNEIYT